MRSPSVDRLIWRSSAARDLLPWRLSAPQPIRFDSSSRSRSSSAIGFSFVGDWGRQRAIGAGCARPEQDVRRRGDADIPHARLGMRSQAS
jgi:hypothetical protein